MVLDLVEPYVEWGPLDGEKVSSVMYHVRLCNRGCAIQA